MRLRIFKDKTSLGQAAAEHATIAIRKAIAEHGRARIIAATGTSQFDFLDALTKTPGIDWLKVEMFHLDEYIGLPITHPASFRRILLERLVRPTGIAKCHWLDVDAADPGKVMIAVGRELSSAPIDVAFLGIGENGHIAFNDPPADFKTDSPYVIVNLDEACRRQQVGEGWFEEISQVPARAVSMSVRQILKAKEVLVVVPDARKAQAVKTCLEGEISPMGPGSILRTHQNTTVYLDKHSACLLTVDLEQVSNDEARGTVGTETLGRVQGRTIHRGGEL